ncbi:MAG TPA: HD domain-containing protein [Terriglobia bacterium]|nr:HD domain-containing protein [Terriglobia bacterium]
MNLRFEVRDPIHGFIYREPDERDVIDTSVFQRLRRLKQLALATLVYPGATHSRFEHSLGAFHLAGKIASALGVHETDRHLIRMAALLHDIGHGPFSHVTEPILRKHTDSQKLGPEIKVSKIHELISWQIIRANPELAKLIADKQREQIVGLLNGTWGHSYLQEIVSGPVDADKQDYLLRDSLFSGVKYGIYDQERLSNTLLVHDDNDDRFLAISIDGIHALEQFVLAKYYMTTQVYRHKIRLITDQMIARAIDLGIEEDKIGWLKKLYSYDGSDEYINEYLRWSDERLVIEILSKETPEGYAKDFFTRLHNRHLFKCIFDVDQNDFLDPNVRSFVFGDSKEFYKPLEKAVADQFGIDKNHVIAYMISFDSATRTESEIPVVHEAKEPTLFHDESTLFKSVDQKIREQRFHIYAPVTYQDEKAKKKRIREFKHAILGLIDRLAVQK